MTLYEVISKPGSQVVQTTDLGELFPAIINAAATVLGDGVDHPNVWAVLSEHAETEYGADFIEFIEAIIPIQDDLRIEKALRLMHGVLTGVVVGELSGLDRLSELESRWQNCTEIAGAKFFLRNYANPDRPPYLCGKFCDFPFTKFETLVDGTVAPCCSIWTRKRLGHISDGGLDEIWNSHSAQEMRESIFDGSFRYCNKERCSLIIDDLLPDMREVDSPEMRRIIDDRRVVLDEAPQWLFLAHDLTCNLACPSCRDRVQGMSAAQESRLQRIEDVLLQPILYSGNSIKLSLSGQGDPWASPHYRSILRTVAERDLKIDLNIHTNGLLMTEARWAEYAGLEKYTPLIDISIDSCTPWVYEVLRRPGRWETLERNLRFIASRRAAGKVRELHLNATVQVDNYHELPRMVSFAEQLGADSMRFYMIQNTGGHLAGSYSEKNIASPDHPLHVAFLETLRHPILGGPTAHLYDVANWREVAMIADLPTDRLGRDYGFSDLQAALREAEQRKAWATAVALCAGGLIRLPGNLELLRTEAEALRQLGFDRLGAYRQRDAEALASQSLA